MPTEWGIKSTDDDGYINLHSDYSSIVYYGEMTRITDPVRPVYTGDYAISITEDVKTNNYDMGWVTQYQITNINTNYLLPFYSCRYSRQQIGIMDVVQKDATTWIVNLIYSGLVTDAPRVFVFAPMTAIQNPTLNQYGIAVYDQNSNLVFTDKYVPLRVDEVITIDHPSSIKDIDKGTCGEGGTSCHVNLSSNRYNRTTGTTYNASRRLYHIIPSAYGGLAYKNQVTDGTRSCNDFQNYKYSWLYQSWASFRGTVGHRWGTQEHYAEWKADFAGALYHYEQSDCSFNGFFAFAVAALTVIFTGGAALGYIAGALAGFALSMPEAAPSIKAYDTDQVFDQYNSSKLIITDAYYYGINLGTPSTTVPDAIVPSAYSYYYNRGGYNTNYFWKVSTDTWPTGETSSAYSLYYDTPGYAPLSLFSSYVWSYTGGIANTPTTVSTDDYIYYRGELITTEYIPNPNYNYRYDGYKSPYKGIQPDTIVQYYKIVRYPKY